MKIDVVETLKKYRNLLKKNKVVEYSVVKLSDLFPTLDVFYEKNILYRDCTLGKKICDDRDVFGYVESIIPIEYHSSYTYCLALFIDQLIKDNMSFFEVFLKDYDLIVFDRIDDSLENALIIDDYDIMSNSFEPYSLERLVGLVLGKYDLSSDEVNLILENFKKDISNIDYSLLLMMSSFDEYFKSFLNKKDYKELRFLLDSRDDISLFTKEFKERHSLEIINQFIDILSNEFIMSNFGIIEDAFLGAKSNIDFSIIMNKDNRSGAYIDKDMSIKLVQCILKDLDKSGKFSRLFEKLLMDNKIVMWEPSERDSVISRYKDMGYDTRNGVDNCFFQVMSKDDGFINLPLTNTIEDVISLIHEFIHYYSLIGVKEYEDHAEYLSELVCIYFETRACDWLIQNGYPEDEVFRLLNYRCANDGFNNVVGGLEVYLSLRSKKNKFFSIDIDNILSDDEIEQKKAWNKFFNEFINKNDYCLDDELDIKKKYILQCVDTLLNMFYKDDRAQLISYMLGTYFAQMYRSDEMDYRMMFVANNLTNPNYDSSELMRVLESGITSVIGLQYVKKEEK